MDVRTLTVDDVTYDIKDATARSNIIGLQSSVAAIEGVIPEGTTTGNKLVNAAAVHNSTISFYQNSEPIGTITLNQDEDARLDFLGGGGGGTGAANLFDFKFADYQLNDTSWLRSDTFSWHNGIKYSDAYGHLEDDIDAATEHVDWFASHITKVGALVDNEGVLSGFTGTTVYATVPAPEASTSLFEMVVKVHTPASLNANMDFINCITAYKGMVARVATNGSINLWLSSNGTSWNIASGVASGVTLSADTDYWMKLSWDGENYLLSYSLDGEEYVDGTPIANTNPLRIDTITLGGTSRENYPWKGTIDLNESYIKVDGETVWEGCEYLTWYEAEDGHRLVLPDQESRIVSMFNSTGVAWYYMIDTENQLFKLPRSKFAFVGLRDTVGKYVPESLPQHTHDVIRYGSLYPWAGNNGATWQNTTTVQSGGANHPAYQDGAPVQQRATQMYLYFYVGTYSQSALAQTAGLNAELFNAKQDVLTGVSGGGDYVVSWQAPTAENGYTWYRLYKSGWVEQGGMLLNAGTGAHTITIPVEMANVEELKKSAVTTPIFISGVIQNQGVTVRNSSDSSWSTTQIDCFSWGATIHIKWQVSGMSA